MATNLVGYMGSAFKRLNPKLNSGNLISGVGFDTPDPRPLEASILTIDRELDELGKPLPAGTIVYRRAGMVSDYYQGGNVPAQFTQDSYLSSSRNADKYSYANCWTKENNQMFFTITCAALGAGRDVAHLRGNTGEAEVLFHRNARFRVDNAAVDKNGNAHWMMTEIASDAGYVWGAHTT